MRKFVLGCTAAVCTAVLMTAPVYADLITPEGYRVVGAAFDDFTNGAQGWIQTAGSWRYLDGKGVFISSAWKEVEGKWYHFNENGYMSTGFLNDNGTIYYLKESGEMACNETLSINGKVCTFGADGAMTSGEVSGDMITTQKTSAVITDNIAGMGPQTEQAAQTEAVAVWPYKAITVVPAENDKSEEYHALDAVCDGILAAIITPEMTKRQKAERIYAYIRGHFTYSGHSRTRDWVHEAYQGLRSNHGDCFTYYAAAQALLTRAGMNCIEVIRNTDNDHYWELVELEDGWWHFDSTPRAVGGYYCLWSDAQMDAFSAAHGGCFAFDHSIYPATP